ncbi:MAG TPA: TIGR01212 family radical SAM protein [Candidatus Enterocloster faecavium]|uniref:TIGR01212 family radical SAM protein n=1 Tax=Candidatus Enterocloster faecavium TaxID=2838560 RepID=A0A9D2L7Z2_9FIRM|nr:TIGR01212 family radical SAM protein [Candidatus Enterocloster faecavium]
MQWGGLPFHSLSWDLQQRFGKKLYKLSLDGGMTCPNRDGTLGRGGCIFCSAGGSGDFAAPRQEDLNLQIQEAKAQIAGKAKDLEPPSYIAYFQSYTNTYAPLDHLEKLFFAAAAHPDTAVLSIATRPDCLAEPVIALLSKVNQIKPVWVELGLQTIHEDTASFIRRGYQLPVFEDACRRLKEAGLETIVHVILGLPGEDAARSLETVSYLADRRLGDGIKLQLLHILKGTDLGQLYLQDPFPLYTMEEYIDLVVDCVELLPPEMVIHRLTGDGPKDLLIAPLWSRRKRLVLGSLYKRFRERNTWQGRLYEGPVS